MSLDKLIFIFLSKIKREFLKINIGNVKFNSRAQKSILKI